MALGVFRGAWLAPKLLIIADATPADVDNAESISIVSDSTDERLVVKANVTDHCLVGRDTGWATVRFNSPVSLPTVGFIRLHSSRRLRASLR